MFLLLGPWHWLLMEGFYQDILAAVIFTVFGTVWAAKPWRFFVQHQKKTEEAQARIEDLLDTRTPGGLRDVLEAVQKEERQ